ncbi:hypothetical protein D3C75_763350 [compost metagenome]
MKSDLSEFHLAGNRLHRRQGLIPGIFRWNFHYFEYTLGPGNTGLDHIILIRHLVQRIAELSGVSEEADDYSDCSEVLQCQPASRNRNQQISNVAENIHERPHHSREDLRPDSGLLQPAVGFTELRCDPLFLVKQGNNTVPGYGFFNKSVQLAQFLLLRFELCAGPACYRSCKPSNQRCSDHGNECQPTIQQQHHRQRSCQHDDTGDDLNQTLIQRACNIIDIIGGAAHQFPVAFAGKKRDRQPLQMLKQILSQAPHRPLRDISEKIVLQPADETPQQIKTQQQQTKLEQPVVTARNNVTVQCDSSQVRT